MIELERACRVYADGTHALRGLSFRVKPGEIVGLIGPNGSGKSSCARLLCAMDLANDGRVVIDGIDPADDERARLAVRERVAFVQQDPVDQIVSTVVFDEVAFGPRNLGLNESAVAHRVTDALRAVELSGFEGRDVNGLSGGEQQRLALASALAMRPRYVVLDEVTSMLDSAARPSFRELVADLAAGGTGVVMVTHDVAEMVMCDSLVALRDGCSVWEGDLGDLARGDDGLWDDCVVSTRYSNALRAVLRAGIDLGACRTPESLARALHGLSRDSGARLGDLVPRLLDGCGVAASSSFVASESASAPRLSSGIVARSVSFSYDEGDPACPTALCGVDLEAPAGCVTLLAGRSGSGKTTLAHLACGLLAPCAGALSIDGGTPDPARCALSFQRPENQLFLDTVYDELAFAPRNLGWDEARVAASVDRVSDLLGIESRWFERSPFELSGGQARRVGLGCVLALDAPAYIFDEPTAGLDAAGRRMVRALARVLARGGRAVMVISHDLDEWAPVADRVALMRDGRVCWQGPASELAARPGCFDAAGIEPPESARLVRALESLRGGGADGC